MRLALVLAGLAVLLLPGAARAAEPHGLRLAQRLEPPPFAPGEFVGGIGGDRRGRVFVVDRCATTIAAYSAAGRLERTWSTGVPRQPFFDALGFAVGPEGDVYLHVASERVVRRFSAEGVLSRTLEIPDRALAPDPANQLGLATRSDGALLISTGDAIVILSREGDVVGRRPARTPFGTVDGGSVAEGAGGLTWIATPDRVEAHQPDGRILQSIGAMGAKDIQRTGEVAPSTDVATTRDGRLWTHASGRLQRFDAVGGVRLDCQVPGVATSFAVARDGTILVAGRTIRRFAPTRRGSRTCRRPEVALERVRAAGARGAISLRVRPTRGTRLQVQRFRDDDLRGMDRSGGGIEDLGRRAGGRDARITLRSVAPGSYRVALLARTGSTVFRTPYRTVRVTD